jgi:RHS repeat-associated protein
MASAFGYDKDGLPVVVGDEALKRGATGQVQSATLGKISEALAYDGFGEILTDAATVGKTTLFAQTFSRDALGRVASANEDSGWAKIKTSYVYDADGRLLKVMAEGRAARAYAYDSNGNRVAKTWEGGKITAAYNADDQLLRYGRTEYRYDANGALSEKIEHGHDWGSAGGWGLEGKSAQRITQYAYDAFGNLKSVNLPDGRRIQYLVDGQNRRVAKLVDGKLAEAFAYQSQTQIAAALDARKGAARRFVYGSRANVPDYMVEGGKEYRILSDQVGTPRLVVDAATGKPAEWLSFDEFGMPLGSEGEARLPFGFAGGLRDRDTGLVRLGARDYDPETGRWTSKDPLLFDGGDTNLFGYVANDPVNFIDPSGLTSTLILAACAAWPRKLLLSALVAISSVKAA